MDLNSGKIITRKRLTIVPITQLVIARVEQLADQQGFKSLKFLNRKKEEFFDSDLDIFAGVDDDNDEDEIFDDYEEIDEEEESDDENEDHELENLKTDLRNDKIIDLEIQKNQ